ncbi:hypothetical protein HY256_09905, partial [Candidatus Sumerlaeota bacterium]|nr:hypothetical protein [Candidatus Sumerlaeota bacterium]
MLALGIFILAFDQIIGLILRSVPPIQDPSIGEAADVRNLYSRMIAGEQTPWLLIGDSVLAGDALAGREADYQHKRVLDFMRSQIGPDEKATFHQLAFNGLLPVDA